MIQTRYQVLPSSIPGAGRGLFLAEPVPRGRIVIAPDAIATTHSWEEVKSRPDPALAMAAAVRWFEDRYTISLDWPDECYINHSFAPNGLWHLGFVFAARDLQAGEELTIDYRHLLPEGEREAFDDAETGKAIIGFSWADSLARSTAELSALLER